VSIQIRIENGKLIIEMPLQQPQPSSTGKTLLIATTHGNHKTGVMHNGKEVTIAVNAFIKNGN
jgi:hypothetical protein